MENIIIQKKRLGRFINLFYKTKLINNRIIIKGMFIYKIKEKKINIKNTKITIGDYIPKQIILMKKGFPCLFGVKINFYKLELPFKEIKNLDIQNKIAFTIKEENIIYKSNFSYTIFGRRQCRTSKVYMFTDDNTSIYFRQSPGNGFYLTVREINITDKKIENTKLNIAKFLSYFVMKKDIVLMFEKKCEKYEESASVLFEKLCDQNYKNIYYILDENSEHYKRVPDKYKKYILNRNSLKHYIYFFKANKFIGTESLIHAIDLRVANRFAFKKTKNKKIDYVFLQHGVMYMVSLTSDLRKGFVHDGRKHFKVVVSSQKEADHFIDAGSFEQKDLYITGLPKFDKNQINKNADKIVIMLTWRRWEYNEVRNDFENSKYYKMILRILESIPKKLLDKVIILPHPLLLENIKESNSKISKYIPDDFIYDDILKDTRVLITDYSSIAYDSFYRGSNVIFNWEEKEECMTHYGENAKLMLNQDNCFGDIVYNKEELSKVIEKNYNNQQETKYIKNYQKIVEFNDNKNTERLIACLKKDKII